MFCLLHPIWQHVTAGPLHKKAVSDWVTEDSPDCTLASDGQYVVKGDIKLMTGG